MVTVEIAPELETFSLYYQPQHPSRARLIREPRAGCVFLDSKHRGLRTRSNVRCSDELPRSGSFLRPFKGSGPPIQMGRFPVHYIDFCDGAYRRELVMPTGLSVCLVHRQGSVGAKESGSWTLVFGFGHRPLHQARTGLHGPTSKTLLSGLFSLRMVVLSLWGEIKNNLLWVFVPWKAPCGGCT